MSPGTPQTFYPSDTYANEILPDGRLDCENLKLLGLPSMNYYSLNYSI
jgi:hypothetical protein